MMIARSLLMLIVVYAPCFLAGLVLLVLGLRGKPRWSTPVCAKCGYDLRGRAPGDTAQCPECGADLKASPDAVHFARGRRHWGLIGTAIGLWVLPFLIVGAITLVVFYLQRGTVSPSNLSMQPTATVIQQIALKPDEPWGWQELERRLTTSKLSNAEAAAAVDHLIKHMQTTKPEGWDQPLSWQRDFLSKAYQAGALSDQQMLRLADAYYGPAPRIAALPRLREGEQSLSFSAHLGNTWAHDFPVQEFTALRQARVDGKPVVVRDSNSGGWMFHGNITGPFTAGPHTLELDFDTALIDPKDTVGLNDRSPPSEWPVGLRRWTRTAKAQFTVLGKDEQPVKLTTDAALDPQRAGGITAEPIVVRPDGSAKKLFVKLSVGNDVSVPLSFDVGIKLGDQTVPAGPFIYFRTGNTTYGGGQLNDVPVKALPADLRTADVILTPNAKYVEGYSQVSQAWGKEIVIPNVPLRRYDLPQGQDQPAGR